MGLGCWVKHRHQVVPGKHILVCRQLLVEVASNDDVFNYVLAENFLANDELSPFKDLLPSLLRLALVRGINIDDMYAHLLHCCDCPHGMFFEASDKFVSTNFG